MLREMGIQVWIPRESEGQTIVAVQEVNVEDNRVESQVLMPEETKSVSIPAEISTEASQDHVSTSLEMRWTLVFDQNDANHEKLRLQVLRVIDDLGGACQILELGSNELQASRIEGQILIAFGQKMGQLVSGERDTVDHLRGILFDAQNKVGEEIPALVTYSLADLIRAPKNKSFFWDDLLWARSVWLDSRLY